MAHNFERFRLADYLIEALKDEGIDLPTEIQERIIPAVNKGEDVIGRSQTGTGKTLAFLLPLLTRLDPEKKETQIVITAPTRELASQLYDVCKRYASFSETTVTSQLIVGGTDRKRMLEKAKQRPHIVIGTPGRILDMMKEAALNPMTVSSFVVDEADQMLDMGFLEEVDRIASMMNENLQLLVFSATIPESLKPFLKKYMNHPKEVEVQPKQSAPSEISHWLIPDRDRDRKEILVTIAKDLNPFLAIIFTNTKESADEVFKRMLAEGFNVDCIHGDIQPRQRKKVLKKLQTAEIQYLVATDLVARGIDVKGVSHIINFEIPKELEYYVHRVGRTARAGWDGTAITFFGRSDQPSIEKLEGKGIHFSYREFKKGRWVTIQKRERQVSSNEELTGKAKAIMKKPKKVKPGYKKKAKFKAEKEMKRNRRINSRKK
ncbi:DEAD/DEAH box helicase [Salisediminibacterium selenitireducens]|uniref:DEAD/DEAH box helicase domain protein n=1 Tax=Bacillus selenitireducens (strain ATCC 700615 / DSM 15326 / MLS10) TaxID=439292 RepID=D6XW87_BACIE|nr:DEAD/DEAH box helicase [Salisediminibacterium selenitireducens]ADH99841.1 DEAD/DEAH box helicase domain protein [[Bacillus] selenitireducens MLS10]